jgi:hypothetical protein
MAMQHSDDYLMHDLLTKVHPQLYWHIVLSASKADLSVQDYVERILQENVPPELDYPQEQQRGLNKAAVESLHRLQEQIRRNHPGQVFEDSAEQLHQIREERMRQLEDP